MTLSSSSSNSMKEFQRREMTVHERALYEGESEDEIGEMVDVDLESQGETTSTGGRSKHLSIDLAGSVFMIASDGRILSLPIPSESSSDPLTWTRSRRILIIAILVLYAATALFLIQTPGNLFEALALEYKEKDMRPFSLDTLAGSPTLAMGISFFFWIPLCVGFGRRPVLLLSSVMLAVATFWAGAAASFYQLLIAICCIGFAVGATISTTLLQLIDLTFIHERPITIASFWALTGFLSLALLGALPAMMDTASKWRILYTATTVPAALSAVLILLYVPETYFFRPPVAFDGRVLVQSGTEKVKVYDEWREVPGRDGTSISSMRGLKDTLPVALEDLPIHTWRVSPLPGLWRRRVVSPKAAVVCFVQIFLCLGNPLVFWVTLLNAVNFGGMMAIGMGFPVVMAKPPYLLSPQAIGRVNFTAAVAALAGLPAACFMLNTIMKRLTLRNRGVRHAEFYLPAFILPVVSGAASVVVYGFAASRFWDPAFYHVAYGLNAFSFTTAGIANTIWVTESLPQWAAPAIAVVGGVSYIASWGITAVLPIWIASWEVTAVSVGLGIGISVVGLLAIPLAFWGKSVRQFIDGHWGTYEVGALRPQSSPRTRSEED